MPEVIPGTASSVQVTAGFDAAAPGYDTHGISFFNTVADRLVERAGLTQGARVLDVGCGAGAALAPAARAAGAAGRLIGMDLSAQMLNRSAQLRLANVSLVRADAQRPPYVPGSFDVVIASMMIFLLPHPERAIRSWLALLRPGGTVAFSWNVGEDPRWRPVIAAIDARVPGAKGLDFLLHHPPFHSADTVNAMLAEAGYNEITTIEEPAEHRYTSPQQWWTVSWHQAARIVWQDISREEQPAAREDALRRLEQIRDPDGGLTRRPMIGYTTARRLTA